MLKGRVWNLQNRKKRLPASTLLMNRTYRFPVYGSLCCCRFTRNGSY